MSRVKLLSYCVGVSVLGATNFVAWEILGQAARMFGSPPGAYYVALGLVYAVPPVVLLAGDAVIRRLLPNGLPHYHRALLLAAFLAFFYRNSAWGYLSVHPHVRVIVLAGVVTATTVAVARYHEQIGRWAAALGVVSVPFFAYYGLAGAPPTQTSVAHVRPALTGGRPGPSIVLLLFDAFSLDGLLDEQGRILDRFSNLRRLSQSAFWARNATTNYDMTGSSVASMLSGRYLQHEKDVREVLGSLAGLLGGGYEWSVYGAHLPYCQRIPAARCFDSLALTAGDWKGLLRYSILTYARFQFPTSLYYSLPHPISPQKAESLHLAKLFLDDLVRARPRGEVRYVHLYIPHSPFEVTPDGRRAYPGKAHSFQGLYGDALRPRAMENYRDEIEWADRLVGEALDRLEAAGALEETLLVITSDHGESRVHSGGARGRGLGKMDDHVARIPLFMKLPTGFPLDRVPRDDYQHVDLVPTILDVAGVKTTERFDGVSLFAPGVSGGRKRAFSAGREWTVDSETGAWRPVDADPPTADHPQSHPVN
ncbi:MAG: sulfatase-like hydrolase/transferase [Nitrospirae bacterium]|nr:sulfatase-like hydrolase/transferase [Nitrospirota bacterium]